MADFAREKNGGHQVKAPTGNRSGGFLTRDFLSKTGKTAT
jgi:hypothetical protein